MRLVHFADTHLGFRQYDRMAPDGGNVRENDIAKTFGVLIDRVIAVAPDVILIGGDVFHNAKPTNAAILTAFNGFKKLADALPDTPVIISAGNHDLAKTRDMASILQILTPLDICVADRESQRFYFEHLGLSVLAVPDAPMLARPSLVPDSRATINLLCMHGEAQGMLPAWVTREDPAVEISTDEIGSGWDYVALGHYHVHKNITSNIAYSGSIDYTSSNIWGELKEEDELGLHGKGFIERDLTTGEQTFHGLPAARPIIDLPQLDAAGMGVETLNDAIRAALEARVIDDAIVRLVVHNVDRAVRKGIDPKMTREFRRRAMGLTLDLRTAETVRATSAEQTRVRSRSLTAMLNERLAERPLPDDVSRDEFVKGGMHYLEIVTTDADRERFQETAQQYLATHEDPYDAAERTAVTSSAAA